jgi:hypothetical protein
MKDVRVESESPRSQATVPGSRCCHSGSRCCQTPDILDRTPPAVPLRDSEPRALTTPPFREGRGQPWPPNRRSGSNPNRRRRHVLRLEDIPTVAVRLGNVNPKEVRRLIARGELFSVTLGRRQPVPGNEVDSYINDHRPSNERQRRRKRSEKVLQIAGWVRGASYPHRSRGLHPRDSDVVT